MLWLTAFFHSNGTNTDSTRKSSIAISRFLRFRGSLGSRRTVNASSTICSNGPSASEVLAARLGSNLGNPRRNTLAFGHHEDRTPTHGYAATREAAMAAFAKSWRRE